MKGIYEALRLEIIPFDSEDVIMRSGNTPVTVADEYEDEGPLNEEF